MLNSPSPVLYLYRTALPLHDSTLTIYIKKYSYKAYLDGSCMVCMYAMYVEGICQYRTHSSDLINSTKFANFMCLSYPKLYSSYRILVHVVQALTSVQVSLYGSSSSTRSHSDFLVQLCISDTFHHFFIDIKSCASLLVIKT